MNSYATEGTIDLHRIACDELLRKMAAQTYRKTYAFTIRS
jgi:hypothetical protein